MSFKLSPLFLSRYEGKQPNWGFGNLSYFVYKRTYARLMPDGRQEEYFDTCRRVTEGVFTVQRKHCHSNRLPWNAHKAQKTAQEFFRRMWEFKFTPPGRGFWIMGTPMVDKIGSAALQNCGFTSTKDVSIDLGNSFAWAMDMLMLGVGVGFDTKGAGTVVIKAPKDKVEHFDITDDREGWVKSIYLLINSYMGGPQYTFGYDLIRPKGAPIKGFGGTASGPEPLRQLHENIREILGNLIGSELTSVAIVDLFNFIGKCVVAGNVRRSAELAIGEIDDADYVAMKDYKKYGKELKDRRWASNNSVFASPLSDFSRVSANIALNGEPGLIFLENARHFGRLKDGWISFEDERYDDADGFNPCAEQCLEDKELCCLVETYPANHDSAEDYLITLKYAYMYAKTVTLIPTHDERTNSVMMRNRRIGCSMSGIQQAIKKFGLHSFLREFCDTGYEVIRRWDRIYSRWLGIPRSIRMTTVKPSGTVSILAGATPGVHFTHSEHYMRLVRVAADSPLVLPLFLAGYKLEVATTDNDKLGIGSDIVFRINKSEDLQLAADKGVTIVAYFPVKEKNYTKSKFDVTLWEQLAVVREMQYYWSDNAVSCTVTVQSHEVDQLDDAIQFYAPYVKTLSFLPLTNHRYEQAPYIECSEQEHDEYAGRLGGLYLNDVAEAKIKGSKFCTTDKCEI
jgi:adenosylcobalamin-dependent ribonucleoside-triphosphate reductase